MLHVVHDYLIGRIRDCLQVRGWRSREMPGKLVQSQLELLLDAAQLSSEELFVSIFFRYANLDLLAEAPAAMDPRTIALM